MQISIPSSAVDVRAVDVGKVHGGAEGHSFGRGRSVRRHAKSRNNNARSIRIRGCGRKFRIFTGKGARYLTAIEFPLNRLDVCAAAAARAAAGSSTRARAAVVGLKKSFDTRVLK